MALYYFDIDDGQTTTIDDVGSDLAGPQAARAEGLVVLAAIARDLSHDGIERTLVAMVRLGNGRPLFRVSVSLSVEELGLRVVPPLLGLV